MLIRKPLNPGVGFRGYELFLQIFVSASRHCHEGLKSGFRFMLHPANENNNAGRAHAVLGAHTTRIRAHCRRAILVIRRMTRALSFALCRQFAIAQIPRLPYHCRFNCNFPTRAKIAHPDLAFEPSGIEMTLLPSSRKRIPFSSLVRRFA